MCLLFRQPFLKISITMINVDKGEQNLWVHREEVRFKLKKVMNMVFFSGRVR